MENVFFGLAAAILVSEQREHERLRATFNALGQVGEVAHAMAYHGRAESVGETDEDRQRQHDAGALAGEVSVLERSYRVGRIQGMRAAHAKLRGDAPDPRRDPAGYLKRVRERLLAGNAD